MIFTLISDFVTIRLFFLSSSGHFESKIISDNESFKFQMIHVLELTCKQLETYECVPVI